MIVLSGSLLDLRYYLHAAVKCLIVVVIVVIVVVVVVEEWVEE